MLSLILACTATTEPDPQDDSGNIEEEEVASAPTPRPYDGTCPKMKGKSLEIESAGQTRTVLFRFPEDPEGAPVWFSWHWLGGTATQTINYLDLQDMADKGWIVVAPETAEGSNHPAFEWGFTGSQDMADADLALFDDVLACLYDQHEVDLDRVYTSGMSAGGLWSTYLSIHRSEALAAAAPYSGGTGAVVSYDTPERQLPVMVTWGGPNDNWNGFSFADANEDYSADLQADGHFVIECVHSLGHQFPNGITDWTETFFNDHPWGLEASPYLTDGLPDNFPSYCSIP